MEEDMMHFSLIKAERLVLYLSGEDRFEVSSQDPLNILGPIMEPMGFVIHDIYQINCHTEKMVASGQEQPTHHLHIAGRRRCPTLSEVRDEPPCHLISQASDKRCKSFFISSSV